MASINLIYFSIIFLFIGCFLCYTSPKYFNINPIKILFYIVFSCLSINTLFFLVLTDDISLVSFSLLICSICILLHFNSNKEFFKLILFILKSYYIFLLSFTITFSFFELITNENIYILTNYDLKFFILFIISSALYLLFEILLFNNLNKEKVCYVLSSINVFVPMSMFVMLVGKNYSFFYILNFSKHSYLVSSMFLSSCLLEVYFGIFTIISIDKSYNLSIYKHKNKILNLQYEIQVNHLKQLEIHQEDIRRMYHDIHNHKVVLQSFIKNKEYDEAINYLDKFGQGFYDDNQEMITSHKVLNSLLLNKKYIALDNNIDFILDIGIPSNLKIYDFDLCIVVGNLIDNAINACNKLDLNNHRYINIKSKIINDNFVFEIKNSFIGFSHNNFKNILSTKKSNSNHGLGLSNVKFTVDKYQGSLSLSSEEKEFNALVRIPLNSL